MKITKSNARVENWGDVKSRNYKLTHLSPYQSVVWAQLQGDHGEVHTNELERVYYIVSGKGEFEIGGKTYSVEKGDVFTIPPQTTYNYRPLAGETLEIILFMELWDN